MGFSSLKRDVQSGPKRSLAVAWGLDDGVLLACRQAMDQGFLHEVIVTGPRERIEAIAAESKLSLEGFCLQPASTPEEGASLAVSLIRQKKSELLMKGNLNTSVILRAVLHKEQGIRARALLSHIAAVELPNGRLTLLTDAAMNVKPDLTQKSQILDNAIQFAWSIGISNPKVAVLASVETVNSQMQDTMDAACLAIMGKRGQFSKAALVDGPLAFDNAYSKEAATQKGIQSDVAGEADIFMVQELTAGNLLYKSLSYVGGLSIAGVIFGATCPIVLTSRADSPESKLNAIALACKTLSGDGNGK
ncbi:MAG TPA: bifunctional enoyl-CoA hydratase/phosphate acetyltransferase [Limnochordia bacterium]|nr:bifunctional enoyl-CoA hydratase/phosphate acetyltransferase [Limnochordia bacterium]